MQSSDVPMPINVYGLDSISTFGVRQLLTHILDEIFWKYPGHKPVVSDVWVLTNGDLTRLISLEYQITARRPCIVIGDKRYKQLLTNVPGFNMLKFISIKLPIPALRAQLAQVLSSSQTVNINTTCLSLNSTQLSIFKKLLSGVTPINIASRTGLSVKTISYLKRDFMRRADIRTSQEFFIKIYLTLVGIYTAGSGYNLEPNANPMVTLGKMNQLAITH
ncbi:hypothetical protein [Serratia aquatilis]|uniref:HTH luxR-type domain-containing protein n=1 Tax=Serratia aquatilis TaxID=1737515 RepID=A0ABV6EBW6_9GAMM